MTPDQLVEATPKQLLERMKVVSMDSAEWRGLVAALQWKAAEKTIRQTRAIVWLMWILAGLTAILLIYTVKLDQRSHATEEYKALQKDH